MNTVKYILLYTLVFSLLFFGCFGVYFMQQGLALFENIDGLEQHYTSFLYMGRWINEICRNIFIEHNFIIPMWNHGMGYGADIPTTLAAYIFDPFNYISALTPEKWSEYVFDGIIVFKFYLCGLAYSAFAFYRRQKPQYVLAGAVIYTFCATMYIGFIQMYFINPMYLFPLLIIGFDRLWNDNKFGMYTLMLMWCFLNHFYFAYMMSLFLLGYGILRFIEDGLQSHNWQSALGKMLKIGGFSAIAIAGAAIILLPLAENMMNQGRMDIKYYLPVIYPSFYYMQILMSFIRPTWALASDSVVGFGAVALPCLLVFFKTSGHIRLKAEFMILTLFLLTPICGYVLNGFSYPANRWVWAYCLVVAYIITLSLQMLDKKKLKSAVWWCLIYIILVGFYTQDIEKSFLFLIEEAVVIFLLFYARGGDERQAAVIFTLAAAFSVLASAFVYFSAGEDKYGKRNMPAGVAYQTVINDSGLPTLAKIMTGDMRRYNQIRLSERSNASWLYGLSGTNFYMSIYNDNVDRFHRSVALLTPPWVTQYLNLDRRAELAALLGVEYFISDVAHSYLLPVGYNWQIKENNYIIARPEFRTSLIYGFEQALALDDFMKLSPFARQQALLQAVILENSAETVAPEELHIEETEVAYKLETDGGVPLNSNGFYIPPLDPYVNILTEPMSFGEIYLYLNGLENLNYVKDYIQGYMLGFAGFDDTTVHSEIQAAMKATTGLSHTYGNKHEWLINLGYTENQINHIRTAFNIIGKYTTSNMKVYLRRKADIMQNISHLKALGENVKMAENKFDFEVNTDKEQYVFMSVPYSKGWQAKVNNQDAPLIKADIAFMALLLPAGKHHVELSYETPYWRLGGFISLAVWLLLGIALYRGRKKRIIAAS